MTDYVEFPVFQVEKLSASVEGSDRAAEFGSGSTYNPYEVSIKAGSLVDRIIGAGLPLPSSQRSLATGTDSSASAPSVRSTFHTDKDDATRRKLAQQRVQSESMLIMMTRTSATENDIAHGPVMVSESDDDDDGDDDEGDIEENDDSSQETSTAARPLKSHEAQMHLPELGGSVSPHGGHLDAVNVREVFSLTVEACDDDSGRDGGPAELSGSMTEKQFDAAVTTIIERKGSKLSSQLQQMTTVPSWIDGRRHSEDDGTPRGSATEDERGRELGGEDPHQASIKFGSGVMRGRGGAKRMSLHAARQSPRHRRPIAVVVPPIQSLLGGTNDAEASESRPCTPEAGCSRAMNDIELRRALQRRTDTTRSTLPGVPSLDDMPDNCETSNDEHHHRQCSRVPVALAMQRHSLSCGELSLQSFHDENPRVEGAFPCPPPPPIGVAGAPFARRAHQRLPHDSERPQHNQHHHIHHTTSQTSSAELLTPLLPANLSGGLPTFSCLHPNVQTVSGSSAATERDGADATSSTLIPLTRPAPISSIAMMQAPLLSTLVQLTPEESHANPVHFTTAMSRLHSELGSAATTVSGGGDPESDPHRRVTLSVDSSHGSLFTVGEHQQRSHGTHEELLLRIGDESPPLSFPAPVVSPIVSSNMSTVLLSAGTTSNTSSSAATGGSGNSEHVRLAVTKSTDDKLSGDLLPSIKSHAQDTSSHALSLRKPSDEATTHDSGAANSDDHLDRFMNQLQFSKLTRTPYFLDRRRKTLERVNSLHKQQYH